MLRLDVLFAERKFSENNCITRLKDTGEMDHYASKRVVPHYERPMPYAVQAVPRQNTGVASTPDLATLYGGANRLLSDEQIQQFISSTVLPHHRSLTSPDQSTKSVQYVAPKAAQASQRGVETGLQTTPITPAKFMEARSPTKPCLPPSITEGSRPQSPKTPGAEDRIAALAGVNSFLSDEQIKQFITSTVLPHHRALTNPQSRKQNIENKRNISAGESNRRPVVQFPDQTNISPLGAQMGTVSGFQETQGDILNNNGRSSQGSPSTLVPLHGTATSSMVPVRYARTNSMETQSLMETSMLANGASSNCAFVNTVSVNGVSANGVSTGDEHESVRNAFDSGVTANHVSPTCVTTNHVSPTYVTANHMSANHVSTSGLSANHVSANDGSASQHHQRAPVPNAQTLPLVSNTMSEGLSNEETQTAHKDKQTLGTAQSSQLASQIQTESTEQDSPVGLQDTKEIKSKASAVKSRTKTSRKSRKSPRKRGKDLKNTGSPKKRRKVVSESPEAEVQQGPESQGNTDSDSEISPDDDDFFNECIQEFFDRLVLADPSKGRHIIFPESDPKNIIPCENYYIDLDLFL